jgi:hypothetical protein
MWHQADWLIVIHVLFEVLHSSSGIPKMEAAGSSDILVVVC